ncbi:MAG: D-alanyl-D-alanine carboxypeptidase, partial [Planctomycetes bacterium]|nr:D-alanyl-D-alanine carboxypeptidase [Planctomycetota bacterium]
MFKRTLLLTLWALALIALARPRAAEAAPVSPDIETAILAQLKKAEGKRGKAGCVVIDLADGATVVSHNAAEPLAPASNMKVLTSVAALATLGPGFEFVTRVVARGSVADGTLGGDLCLIGGGDPNLSGRFHDGDVTALFRAWAARLASMGIRRVAGDIQYESSLFGGEAYCDGWPRDDQYTRWYCAEVSALAFNDNCVGVRVIPGKAGEPAKIETIPPTAYVTVIN